MVKGALDPLSRPVEIGIYGGDILALKAEQLQALLRHLDPYMDRVKALRISSTPLKPERETMDLLKQYRVRTIELGIPSFNDTILAAVNRRHRAADLYASYSHFRAEGFQVGLQVMVGLPGETDEDVEVTARELCRLTPDFIRIYPLVVLRETALCRTYEEGLFQPLSLDVAVDRVLFVFLHATRQGIRVVKMGLTDNEAMKEKVAAGPYHPAFGYLVKARAFYLAVREAAGRSFPPGPITVLLNRRDIPHLTGYRRSHLVRFEQAGFRVDWEDGGLKEGTFALRAEGKTVQGTIFDALPVTISPV
jgi:histone acetyltransferase (RNA polymerase elongator complex component)